MILWQSDHDEMSKQNNNYNTKQYWWNKSNAQSKIYLQIAHEKSEMKIDTKSKIKDQKNKRLQLHV